jgi:hypothetical protein
VKNKILLLRKKGWHRLTQIKKNGYEAAKKYRVLYFFTHPRFHCYISPSFADMPGIRNKREKKTTPTNLFLFFVALLYLLVRVRYRGHVTTAHPDAVLDDTRIRRARSGRSLCA